MTLRQEAYREIDSLSDENIRFVIELMRKIQPSDSIEKTQNQKRAAFLATAGKIDVDENAVKELRERSMV